MPWASEIIMMIFLGVILPLSVNALVCLLVRGVWIVSDVRSVCTSRMLLGWATWIIRQMSEAYNRASPHWLYSKRDVATQNYCRSQFCWKIHRIWTVSVTRQQIAATYFLDNCILLWLRFSWQTIPSDLRSTSTCDTIFCGTWLGKGGFLYEKYL